MKKMQRKFIRTLFPKIYTYACILSLILAIFLLKVEVFYSFIFFFVISLGYFYSKFFLMKKINSASDEKDEKKKI